MYEYECEECKGTFEIEQYEAECGNHEYYQHGMCQDCFDKSIEE